MMSHHNLLRRSAWIALLWAVACGAQSTGVGLILQGGPTLGWLQVGRTVDHADAIRGAVGSLAVQYDLNERFGVRLGAGYHRKGSSVKVGYTDVDGIRSDQGVLRTELDYLMIPLMARFSFGKGTRFSVGAGPYAGYLAKASSIQELGPIGTPAEDITKRMKRWDMGLCASVAAGWSLGPRTTLSAEVRYDKGFTNINRLPIEVDGRIRTHAACLLVGLGYRLGNPG